MIVNCVNSYSNVKNSPAKSYNNKPNVKSVYASNLGSFNHDSCLIEQISVALDIALKNADKEINNSDKTIHSIAEIKNMYIAKTILKIGKKSIDDILSEKYKNYSQVAFAGTKDENQKRMKVNKWIIHGAAVTAAGAAAALAQTPGGDEAALTALTTGMAAGLCINYNNSSLGVFASIASQILGKLAGEGALKYVVKWIPGVGNVANAAITFSLHETTGWALVAALENFEKNGTVSKDIDKYIADAGKYKQ